MGRPTSDYDSDTRLALLSPLEAGYSMPAEWEPHARTWIAWPDRKDLWGERLPRTQQQYAAVAEAIARFEPVTMVVNPESQDEARRICTEEVDLLPLPIDHSWIRDHGPSFIKHPDGRVAGVSWHFNCWGGKIGHATPGPGFPEIDRYREDAMLGRRLLNHVGAPVYHSPLTMEGGGLHVDGEGTILTTESVVLNPNRNPGLDKKEAERELCRALGAEKVIWLPGAYLDITDGHVDGSACFAGPGVVLYTDTPDRQNPYAAVAEEHRKALEAATDAQGRKLEVVPLWEPPAQEGREWAGYINFALANGGVVMAHFGVSSDDPARETLAELFPDRTVVQVDISDIEAGGGGIHCMTQQQPA
jgi:agmatine deiminase